MKPFTNLYIIFMLVFRFFIVAFHFYNVCLQPTQAINILN